MPDSAAAVVFPSDAEAEAVEDTEVPAGLDAAESVSVPHAQSEAVIIIARSAAVSVLFIMIFPFLFGADMLRRMTVCCVC